MTELIRQVDPLHQCILIVKEVDISILLLDHVGFAFRAHMFGIIHVTTPCHPLSISHRIPRGVSSRLPIQDVATIITRVQTWLVHHALLISGTVLNLSCLGYLRTLLLIQFRELPGGVVITQFFFWFLLQGRFELGDSSSLEVRLNLSANVLFRLKHTCEPHGHLIYRSPLTSIGNLLSFSSTCKWLLDRLFKVFEPLVTF